MTGSDDAAPPHAAAESDDRDPSRAANQIRNEPIPPTPAHEPMPASDSAQPHAPADGGLGDRDPDRPQAGAPAGAVTDLTPALGTSEELEPVQGVRTFDAGPDAEQVDNDGRAHRSRAAGTT